MSDIIFGSAGGWNSAKSSGNDGNSYIQADKYEAFDKLSYAKQGLANAFIDEVDGRTGTKEDLKNLILGMFQFHCAAENSLELVQDTTGGYDSYTLTEHNTGLEVANIIIIDGRDDFGDSELELEKVYRPSNNDKDKKKKEEEIKNPWRFTEPEPTEVRPIEPHHEDPDYRPSEFPEFEEPEEPDEDYEFDL